MAAHPADFAVLDNYAGPDGGPPAGPDWANVGHWGDPVGYVRVGGQMAQSGGGWRSDHHLTSYDRSVAPVGYGETIDVVGSGDVYWFLFADPSAMEGYALRLGSDGSSWTLFEFSGSGSTLATYTQATSAGDGACLIADVDGNVTAWYRSGGVWTLKTTVPDTTWTGQLYLGKSSANAAARWDDTFGGHPTPPTPGGIAQTATYEVRAAWAATASNTWRLDHSPLDGTDILTDPFAVTFDGPRDNLTDEPGHGVKTVSIRRGRDDPMDRTQMGECTIVLHDPDGLYNPRNTTSPLTGQLLPMRQVTVTADNGNGPRHLFRGFIRTIEHDPRPNALTTTINAVDLFIVLSRHNPMVETPAAHTTGAAITAILDAIEWTDPTLRDLDTGDTFPDGFTADGNTPALSLIEGLLESERGDFVIDGAGAAVYRDRHTRALTPTAGTVTDTMMAMRPGVDLDSVRNRARVIRVIGTVDGEPQTAADGASIATYGPADHPEIRSPYLTDDAQARQLAGYLVGVAATPKSPVWGLEQINRDPETLTAILDRTVGDRIEVVDSDGHSGGDYFIEAVRHEITDGGLIHRASWTLSERGPQVFIVDASVIDGPDRISY